MSKNKRTIFTDYETHEKILKLRDKLKLGSIHKTIQYLMENQK